MNDEELIPRLHEIQGEAGLYASAAAYTLRQRAVEIEKLRAEINRTHEIVEHEINWAKNLLERRAPKYRISIKYVIKTYEDMLTEMVGKVYDY